MAKSDTKTVGVVMPNAMAADLEKRAASLHISTSKYCVMVLEKWAASGETITISED